MREAVAAGRFYPGDPEELRHEVEGLLSGVERGGCGAAVAPHAGYRFSGGLAAVSCGGLADSDTYVLVGPNHTGVGEPVALSGRDWSTPLGEVPVDRESVESLDFPVDESAHDGEHSLEVQLPFLQALHDDFSVVPICMMDQSRGSAERVAAEVADLDAPVLASSDLTHYEPLGGAKRRDEKLLDRVLNLDLDGFYGEAENSSACGYGPIAVAVTLAGEVGLEPELGGYGTSADATGDESSVVGYSSILFT